MPLVIVTVAPEIEQEPVAETVTAPVVPSCRGANRERGLIGCAVSGTPVPSASPGSPAWPKPCPPPKSCCCSCASAAFDAVTEQVPVPLVIVTVLPEKTEQAPVAENVTAPVPVPPAEPTVNVAPYACAVVGMPVTVNAACVASVAETVLATEVALL